MKTVEVLLRENMEPLGKCGDIVRVKSGYARNYLLPHRIAVQATEDNKKAMARRRLKLDAEEAERMAEIETRILVLQGIGLTTVEKTDESGRLYGSVSAHTVVELLKGKNFDVDEKDVRIDTPIKVIGTHSVKVHVHGDRYAELKIDVQSESGVQLPAEEPAKAPTEAPSEQPASADQGTEEVSAD